MEVIAILYNVIGVTCVGIDAYMEIKKNRASMPLLMFIGAYAFSCIFASLFIGSYIVALLWCYFFIQDLRKFHRLFKYYGWKWRNVDYEYSSCNIE